MCGIAGIVSPQNPDLLRKWLTVPLQSLRHRGPDDHGWLAVTPTSLCTGREGTLLPADVQAVLMHRRLSILDLSPAGWQPMATLDDRWAIVFNGEIYNYLELREQLSRQGCVFRSQSDTEVLLQALVHWGPAALGRFVGMFALGLLDIHKRTLLLARDFFGIKPLYYAHRGATFAFASEIKPLLHLPFVGRSVHPQRLYEYLCLSRTDHDDGTLLDDIHQLPAAHYLCLSLDHPDQFETIRWWQLDLREKLDLSFEEAAGRLRELFLKSVRLHLRSDVPVGAALSGGIDSSAIVNAMRAIEPKADLHAFSYIADDPALCEERWIDQAAQQAGAIVHKVRPLPGELVDDLDELVATQEEPFGSTSIYAQYRVFRAAQSAGIKVMLDGQGADEMLAGYRPYLSARVASLLARGNLLEVVRLLWRARSLPETGSLWRLLLHAGRMLVPSRCLGLAERLMGRWLMPSWLNRSWFLERGVQVMPLRAWDSNDFLREQLRRTLTTTSLPMLLRYEDRNSMASSIESRVPFLTPELASFVLRLPEEYLIGRDGTSKNVFRRAMRGLVPDAILDRRDKIGFATPEQRWLTTLRPWVEKTLASERAQAVTALNLPVVRAQWQAVLAGKRGFDSRVWRWVNLIRWVERFDIRIGA